MGFEHSFDEKIDVIDLIINVLKDHESRLDELVSRLEEVSIAPIHPSLAVSARTQPIMAAMSATLKEWIEFREKASDSKLVAFKIEDGSLKVSAMARGMIYVYIEEIPLMDIRYRTGEKGARIESVDLTKPDLMPKALKGKLECGLNLNRRHLEVKLPDGSTTHKIIYDVDPGTVKSWLSYELEIEEKVIVQGEIKI